MKKFAAFCVAALALGFFLTSVWAVTYPFTEERDPHQAWHVALKLDGVECHKSHQRLPLIASVCEDY